MGVPQSDLKNVLAVTKYRAVIPENPILIKLPRWAYLAVRSASTNFVSCVSLCPSLPRVLELDAAAGTGIPIYKINGGCTRASHTAPVTRSGYTTFPFFFSFFQPCCVYALDPRSLQVEFENVYFFYWNGNAGFDRARSVEISHNYMTCVRVGESLIRSFSNKDKITILLLKK